MTTKTRYGVYGIAAIVAILSLSLIAANLTTQQATAEAARKVGMSTSNIEIAPAVSVQSTFSPIAQDIGTMYLKSNDKGDWMVEGVIECATAIQAKASGKQSNLSGGTAGAKVWVEMDGQPINIMNGEPINEAAGETLEDAQWNLCQQTFEMKSNFNDLIITCTEALEIDPDYAGCNEDFNGDGIVDSDPNKLVFLCDVTGEDGDVCEQSLEVFTKVAGTHPIAVMLHNVAAADSHEIIVYAALEAGASQDSTLYESEIIADSENFVDAGVVLGKRLFSVETLAYQG